MPFLVLVEGKELFSTVRKITLNRCRELIGRLNGEAIAAYYKTLINLLYFTVDYQADTEAFYYKLQVEFDQFMEQIETIVDSLNTVCPKSFDNKAL